MNKVNPEEKEIVIDAPETAQAIKEAVQPVLAEESEEAPQFEERVIQVDRVSRTQKGGRRMRFRALVIVGNKQGSVGMGLGKAGEITTAVAKATYSAKKNLITVPIVRNTIPHQIYAKFDTANVMLKPAAVGTSIIAGSSMRPILELAGVENVVAKCLTRTTNKVNNAYATIKALSSLKDIKTVAPRGYRKSKAVNKTEVVKPALEKVEAPKAVAKPKKTAAKSTKTKGAKE